MEDKDLASAVRLLASLMPERGPVVMLMRGLDDARDQCLNLKLYWPQPTDAIP